MRTHLRCGHIAAVTTTGDFEIASKRRSFAVMELPRSPRFRLPLLATALLVIRPAVAIEAIELDVGAVATDGWRVDDLNITLALGEHALEAWVRIRQGRLSAPELTVTSLEAYCPELQLDSRQMVCRAAEVTVDLPQLGRQSIVADVLYGPQTGTLDVRVTGLVVAGGAVDLEGEFNSRTWRLGVWGARLQLAGLALLAQQALGLALPSVSGTTDIELELAGGQDRLVTTDIAISLQAVTGNNETGTVASDKLAVEGSGSFVAGGAQWSGQLTLALTSGQAYVDPMFFDLAAAPLSFTAIGSWDPAERLLRVDQFLGSHREVAEATASGSLLFGDEPAIETLDLDVETAYLPGFYRYYLQPFLLGTALDSLDTRGRLRGEVIVADKAVQRVGIESAGIAVDDAASRFTLESLAGTFCWTAQPTPDCRTALDWQAAAVYGLPFGAAALELELGGDDLRLREPVRLPLLDGALDVKRFDVRSFTTDALALEFDAALEPVDLRQLSEALGWQYLFPGTLAGRLPRLSYSEGELTLGGRLEALVFDGVLAVDNLRLSELFGLLPRLSADIELENLDLELVTEAFALGTITGRLDGYLRGLQLLRWSPIAFDASFATPLDDRSRHRISQRAIENLSSFGGSGGQVAAVLSSGLFKFFEEFSYDRIGVSCRLRDDVCEMDGVEPINGRYYIVKGKGLPRIDMIGEGKRVAWSSLLRRLQRIQATEDAVIQ